MKKPIIGIVGRFNMDECTPIWSVHDEYRLAVIKANGIPFMILPTETIDVVEQLNLCDGILLPGGSTWNAIDEFICRYAFRNNIAILGICLGMQVMVSVDSKEINDGIDDTIKNDNSMHKSNKNFVHEISIEKNTYLSDILKKQKLSVNSRHNYHVKKPRTLKVSAYSSDGIIEAVEKTNHKFAIGVQWHPENKVLYDEIHKKIFEEFIKKAGE